MQSDNPPVIEEDFSRNLNVIQTALDVLVWNQL